MTITHVLVHPDIMFRPKKVDGAVNSIAVLFAGGLP